MQCSRCCWRIASAVQPRRKRRQPSDAPWAQVDTDPPFSWIVCAVIQSASSEARQTQQAPTSSGSPARPTGMDSARDRLPLGI